MSLQGDLKDFSITNILPMIKTENKTGALEVLREEKTVRVSFLNGQVVYAHAGEEELMKRLKETMLAGGMITLDGWRHLEIHSGSPDALWNTLAKIVPPETAGRLLRRQVTDTLFDLLRFKKGKYTFIPAKTVDYPATLINPMDVDFLLMEGCRIADEFSLLEQKLPKPSAILRKSISEANEKPPAKPGEALQPKDFAESLEFVVLREAGVEINEHENRVLTALETPHSLHDLMNRVDLSNFDTYAAVLSLLKKHVIAEMSRKELAAARKPQSEKLLAGYYFLAVIAAIAAFAAYHRVTYMHPAQMEGWKAYSSAVNSARAGYELGELLEQLRNYQNLTGNTPRTLDELKKNGIVGGRCLQDPWGMKYRYVRTDDSFALFSTGEDREPSPDDIHLTP